MELIGLLGVMLVGLFLILRSVRLRGGSYGLTWTLFGALVGVLLLLIAYRVLHM